MSSERLREIRERLDGATPGPWVYNGYRAITDSRLSDELVCDVPSFAGDFPTIQGRKDADFIAHAPSDIRWLLDRVEELEEHLELSREESAKWEENYREAVNPGSQKNVEWGFTAKKSPSAVIRPEGSND